MKKSITVRLEEELIEKMKDWKWITNTIEIALLDYYTGKNEDFINKSMSPLYVKEGFDGLNSRLDKMGEWIKLSAWQKERIEDNSSVDCVSDGLEWLSEKQYMFMENKYKEIVGMFDWEMFWETKDVEWLVDDMQIVEPVKRVLMERLGAFVLNNDLDWTLYIDAKYVPIS